jgi:hypothetical protein
MLQQGEVKVYCIKEIDLGNFPGRFWDTGVFLTPLELAEGMAMQHSAFMLPEGHEKRKLVRKIADYCMEVSRKHNVWPDGKCGLTEDARIIVDKPYYIRKGVV